MSQRDTNVRFVKNDETGEYLEARGFIEDLISFLALGHRLWRVLPLLLALLYFWKHFQISVMLTDVTLEVVCGAGCSCSCPTKNKF